MRNVSVARVYDEPGETEGYRVLVDRLWPRGVRKDSLEYDEWCKEIAPSHELRKWFGHEPSRFGEFRERYRAELRGNSEPAALLERSGGNDIVLLIGAKDTTHSQGVVLRDYLLEMAGS